MSTKSKIGLAIAAVAVSLLLDVLAFKNAWPTPGGYLFVQLFHPGARPDVKTDLRILWITYAAVYVGTNFFCCLAIFYAIYRIFRKFQQDSRDSAT